MQYQAMYRATAGLIAGLVCQFASAGVLYEYDVLLSSGTQVETSYDSDGLFNFSFSTDWNANARNNSGSGFWMVVTDGPEPQDLGDDNYAILFSDFKDVWAYQYRGNNTDAANPLQSSWKNRTLLDYWSNAVSRAAGNVYSFTLDVSDLNSLGDSTLDKDVGEGWKGLQFGEQFGVWFHGHDAAGASGNSNGLNNFTYSRYEADHATTIELKDKYTSVTPPPAPPRPVPAPATGVLVATGLLWFAYGVRRRREGSSSNAGQDLC